jgi:hypothetical protein
MSFQASLDAEPSESLEIMESDIREILEGVEGYLPRVEPDFDDNPRDDVFVQMEDYNAFLTADNLQFHGLDKGSVKTGWTSESEEIWEYLERVYVGDFEEKYLEDELEWK